MQGDWRNDISEEADDKLLKAYLDDCRVSGVGVMQLLDLSDLI